LIFHNDTFSEFLRDKQRESGNETNLRGERRSRENTFEPSHPRRNGASWPQLIPRVSYFAQTAPDVAETGSDVNLVLIWQINITKSRLKPSWTAGRGKLEAITAVI
jgi:hypothetical protein